MLQVGDPTEFDRSWLEERVDPEEYFSRLLERGVAQRTSWVRDEIEADCQLVREVWSEGDELWYWRFRIRGGISGIAGLVLMRNGEVFRLWCGPRIL